MLCLRIHENESGERQTQRETDTERDRHRERQTGRQKKQNMGGGEEGGTSILAHISF